MQIKLTRSVFSVLIVLNLAACSGSKKMQETVYVPDDKELYKTIVMQDSIYFDAYNKCDMAKQEEMYNDNIEFYHDHGGLMTKKQDILEGIRKNICGKVTRELVPGSIEVYPIKGFGAIEMGMHKFRNNQEKENPLSGAGKFILIWQYSNNRWTINRVVSLH